MAPRTTLAQLLVLATLALPGASAIGEEVVGTMNAGAALADATLVAAQRTVAQALPPSGEPPADEPQSHEPPAQTHEHEHGTRDADPAPEPAEEPSPVAPLVRPIARLVPIPDTSVGPAPRLDLALLTDAIDQVAPEPAPSRAAGLAAPVAPAAGPGPSASPPPSALAPSALAVAATAAAVAAAPAAAGALWERLRNLGVLALLYSRIAKERLLDHGARERLLDAIRATPGLAVADLADKVAMPRNTVTYHLRVLEREGLVSSTRNGRNRLFFAPGALPQRENAGALATLRHETALAIAREIGANPGVDQKAICERVGLSPSLAHWHADRLVASGLVDKRREGRYVRYYPGASFGIVDARSA